VPAPQPITRRVKDEPEFTADDRPPSFQHVFTDELLPPPPRRWPLLLLFAMILGGAVGAVALVLKSRSAVVAEATRDASVVVLTADAGRPMPPPPPPPAPVDAAPDAADLIVLPEPGAGRPVRVVAHHDAGAATLPDTPNHRGTIMVQVLTKPEGASLFDGTHYRGPGGAELEEAFGTKLAITCRQTGYKPATVEINFDGNTTAVLCELKRIKICINNIKNPFDDCEVDTNGPAPTTP
jgi:hypothetical protein